MIRKNIGLILLSIVLFALAGIFVINGFVPAAPSQNNSSEKLNDEYTLSSPGEIQDFSSAEPMELNFSGKILTCTNFTDVEQVIDLRLTNLEAENKSVSIYPINITLDLLSEQILRIDLFISPGISTLKLVSNDGEEIQVDVPPCVNPGSSGSDNAGPGMQTTTSSGTPTGTSTGTPTITPTNSKAEEIPEFPTIALPIMTIIALLFIMKKTR